MEEESKSLCPACEMLWTDCICCGCGHVCPRDLREPYCPVCLPGPADDKNAG